MKTAILFILLTAISLNAQVFLQHRENFKLDKWQFYKGDFQTAESGGRINMQGWQEVTVPHTWNAEDILTNGEHYYQGIGWYRTRFEIPVTTKPQRYFLRFEGVSLVTDVFLNGTYVGGHQGGYSAFCFEITPFIEIGESNTLAVKVDNSMQPDVAPSGVYLYPLYGGIYRPVTVFATDNMCISPLDFASGGVYIHPQNISAESADIEVETLLDAKQAPVIATSLTVFLPPKGKKGKGLYGEYFSNPDFKGKPKHTRIDTEINASFRAHGPFEDMAQENFSILWTGRFIPEKSGLYKFVLNSDDGSRLYIDGKRIINHWGDHPATEMWGEIRLEANKEVPIKIEYFQHTGGASIKFGWMFIDESEKPKEANLKIAVVDSDGKTVAQSSDKVALKNNSQTENRQKLNLKNPHLWDAKRDPHLYLLQMRLEDLSGNLVDAVDQPLGLRSFEVDRDKGLILNGKPYDLYGVCRHQEWEGLGPALTDKHHEIDVQNVVELGANGMRLAHYQQADKMYSLCDEYGLVVWAEIPNTPAYRKEVPGYLENCKTQLTELIKQNYNHPSILFWGMYNEIPIPAQAVKLLHDTAKQLDPVRLTTQADYTAPLERHSVTDVAAWNWYFGWYYDAFDKYSAWYDDLHQNFPEIKGGLSEYGAGGCISQQDENPERPDPTYGRFFAEQYQRLYHEKVWANIKDRPDIWCKFIWNMYDFSWTIARRGDRDFINHKGLMTHDRQVKKDAFWFYKANWSTEPVLYILSRRNVERTEAEVPVAVYTNLDEVELYVNGNLSSKKKMESEIHKISWEKVKLMPGENQISVIGFKDGKKFTDACQWKLKK